MDDTRFCLFHCTVNRRNVDLCTRQLLSWKILGLSLSTKSFANTGLRLDSRTSTHFCEFIVPSTGCWGWRGDECSHISVRHTTPKHHTGLDTRVGLTVTSKAGCSILFAFFSTHMDFPVFSQDNASLVWKYHFSPGRIYIEMRPGSTPWPCSSEYPAVVLTCDFEITIFFFSLI